MSREDEYRRRADDLLRLAAGADNMADRSRLIGQAAYWHELALAAHEGRDLPHDNDDGQADDELSA